MFGGASLLGFALALARQDWAYLSVLVWAFVGIAVKPTPASAVVLSALVAAALILGLNETKKIMHF